MTPVIFTSYPRYQKSLDGKRDKRENKEVSRCFTRLREFSGVEFTYVVTPLDPTWTTVSTLTLHVRLSDITPVVGRWGVRETVTT